MTDNISIGLTVNELKSGIAPLVSAFGEYIGPLLPGTPFDAAIRVVAVGGHRDLDRLDLLEHRATVAARGASGPAQPLPARVRCQRFRQTPQWRTLQTNRAVRFHGVMNRRNRRHWDPEEPLFGDAGSRPGTMALAATLAAVTILIVLAVLAA